MKSKNVATKFRGNPSSSFSHIQTTAKTVVDTTLEVIFEIIVTVTYPLAIMKVCTKFQCNPFNICLCILVWTTTVQHVTLPSQSPTLIMAQRHKIQIVDFKMSLMKYQSCPEWFSSHSKHTLCHARLLKVVFCFILSARWAQDNYEDRVMLVSRFKLPTEKHTNGKSSTVFQVLSTGLTHPFWAF